MKKKHMRTNTRDFDEEIKALMQLRDSEIDTSDIPEVTDWSKAVVGRFYRPLKESITIRLDADIVAWLKAEGPGYQTRINTLLRRIMTSGPQDAQVLSDTQKAEDREVEVQVEDQEPITEPEGRASIAVEYHFPNLGRYELAKCEGIAQLIEGRGCVFAPVN